MTYKWYHVISPCKTYNSQKRKVTSSGSKSYNLNSGINYQGKKFQDCFKYLTKLSLQNHCILMARYGINYPIVSYIVYIGQTLKMINPE